ncbi:MAG: hypothetical protein WAK95_10780 [Desulfobacterales bacterium]
MGGSTVDAKSTINGARLVERFPEHFMKGGFKSFDEFGLTLHRGVEWQNWGILSVPTMGPASAEGAEPAICNDTF